MFLSQLDEFDLDSTSCSTATTARARRMSAAPSRAQTVYSPTKPLPGNGPDSCWTLAEVHAVRQVWLQVLRSLLLAGGAEEAQLEMTVCVIYIVYIYLLFNSLSDIIQDIELIIQSCLYSTSHSDSLAAAELLELLCDLIYQQPERMLEVLH